MAFDKERNEIRTHLTTELLPFWEKLKDEKLGGYYGRVESDGSIVKDAYKGGVLNSRILWFFSNAYLTLKDERYLEDARHSFDFFKYCFYDRRYGGSIWSVNYNGTPLDTQKQVYNQGFAIYGLSSYYDASKDPQALRLAMELFQRIERFMRDDRGYLETFARDFTPVEDTKLSPRGLDAARTMNSLLHLMEGYTELYRVSRYEEVGARLREMLDILNDHVYNPEKHRLECFFDLDYNSLKDEHSFGHDIEASWLVDRTLEILDDPAYTKKIRPLLEDIFACSMKEGFTGSWLMEGCFEGKVDSGAGWWSQGELIVALINAWQKDPGHTEYLEQAGAVWNYIKENLIDSAHGGEWRPAGPKDGVICTRALVSEWKCPYHNGRMCFEVIRRLG